MTNNEFFSIFSDYQYAHYATKTRITRLSLVQKHFCPQYGLYDLNSITPAEINSIYKTMEEEHYAYNTLYGMYAALSAYFKLAIDKGFYDGLNPVSYARTIYPERRNY